LTQEEIPVYGSSRIAIHKLKRTIGATEEKKDGEDGTGNNGQAPNLKEYDDVLVKHVLEHGKKGLLGTMPSFKGRLTDVQEKAVAAYIRSIKEN